MCSLARCFTFYCKMNNSMVGVVQKIFRISTMSDLRNQSEREVDPILHLDLKTKEEWVFTWTVSSALHLHSPFLARFLLLAFATCIWSSWSRPENPVNEDEKRERLKELWPLLLGRERCPKSRIGSKLRREALASTDMKDAKKEESKRKCKIEVIVACFVVYTRFVVNSRAFYEEIRWEIFWKQYFVSAPRNPNLSVSPRCQL